MTIGDYGSYISSAGCNIGGFGGSVNGAGAPTLIDAVFVSGAGTEEANGLYIPNGTIGGRTTYLNTNASGVNIYWDNVYNIYRILVSDLLYYTSNSPANPWDGIYLIYEGSEPLPTVRQATTADS
jgi:hypothetical protein